jgi:uncharacterized protein YegL
MAGRKIETLNHAIQECIKPMQDIADENPNAQVLVRALRFADGAGWIQSQPTEVHNFRWTDLDAGGLTDMGAALKLLGESLRTEVMPPRGLPPVLVLVSDGQPTDNFDRGLKALMDQPWGIKSVRIAVAIGDDADLDVLQKFIGNPEVKPLVANNAADLVKKIRWASTVPLKAASSPTSRSRDADVATSNVPIPPPPPDTMPASPMDIF